MERTPTFIRQTNTSITRGDRRIRRIGRDVFEDFIECGDQRRRTGQDSYINASEKILPDVFEDFREEDKQLLGLEVCLQGSPAHQGVQQLEGQHAVHTLACQQQAAVHHQQVWVR